ncbi:MAG TPA: PIN domain-containing protein [Gemmatimonadaceae bacterium]
MTVIADTGALYALVDASDAWHACVVDWWRANREPVVVPVCVLPEVCYLLHTRISQQAEAAFVRAVAKSEFIVEALEAEDVSRAAELVGKYADLQLGFVDATVIATAERLDVIEVLTTDRRHFSAVRPHHAGAFRLGP